MTKEVLSQYSDLQEEIKEVRKKIAKLQDDLKKIESGELKAAPEIVEADAECCGQHEICEKESLLAAVSKKIEYYDDEELDRFRGRPSNGYNEEEVEEFREIMYTCKEDEVAGWSRSLQLRGIELPDELKDELFLIVGERRFK